jgi:hypothetical protein
MLSLLPHTNDTPSFNLGFANSGSGFGLGNKIRDVRISTGEA